MGKKLTGADLKAIGGRVIESKPKLVPDPKPAEPEPNKDFLLVQQALESAQAAEAEAIRAAKVAERQTDLMQQLIDKMPVHEGLPPITGFEFIRDAGGMATGVTFIRAMKVLN